MLKKVLLLAAIVGLGLGGGATTLDAGGLLVLPGGDRPLPRGFQQHRGDAIENADFATAVVNQAALLQGTGGNGYRAAQHAEHGIERVEQEVRADACLELGEAGLDVLFRLGRLGTFRHRFGNRRIVMVRRHRLGARRRVVAVVICLVVIFYGLALDHLRRGDVEHMRVGALVLVGLRAVVLGEGVISGRFGISF